MLEAFLSPPYVARLQILLASCDGNDGSSLLNMWLLSPTIHRAFREGHVDVRPKSQVLSRMLGRASAESNPDEASQNAEVSGSIRQKAE